jgi:hypothetical protein
VANFLTDHIKLTHARTAKETASWRFPNYPAAPNRVRIQCQGEPELRKLPARSPRYTLILRDDNTGQIREWAILQGPRANNLIICAQGKEIIGGWDKLFSSLSARLSEPVRVFV